MARRHLLAPPRSLPPEPDSVLRVFDRLGSIQFDPLEVAGRNHDLVLLRARRRLPARVDRRPASTRRASLFEAYNKGLSLLPDGRAAVVPDHLGPQPRRATRRRVSTSTPRSSRSCWSGSAATGRSSSTDVEPRAAIDWYWRPTNQVRAILEALAEAGILGLARREGNRRVYDLVERLFPAELLAERRPQRDQRRHKLLSRYRAHGLLGRRARPSGVARDGAQRAPDRPGARARTELRRGRRARAGRGRRASAARGSSWPRTSTTSTRRSARSRPDRRAASRPASRSSRRSIRSSGIATCCAGCWDFDYVWEVYVPAKKRRWGYYVLPLLYGDRLVGRIEPRIDRATGTLRILGLWWEDGFDPLAEPGFGRRFADAIRAHRRLRRPRPGRLAAGRPHRPFVATVRDLA